MKCTAKIHGWVHVVEMLWRRESRPREGTWCFKGCLWILDFYWGSLWFKVFLCRALFWLSYFDSVKVLTSRIHTSQAPVSHACNPSYSGGRHQEDWGSRPAWENSLRDPISKIAPTKRGQGRGPSARARAYQVWGPKFKHQYCLPPQKNSTI
jgi:hypothetical protein